MVTLGAVVELLVGGIDGDVPLLVLSINDLLLTMIWVLLHHRSWFLSIGT